MKNIMNTTLVAVAVAIACVGNVDARSMVQGSGAKEMLTAGKNALSNPTEENKQDVSDQLSADGKSEDEIAVLALTNQKIALEGAIKLAKEERDNLKYGWFGFGTTKETQDAYREASATIKQKEADLKAVLADIAKKAKITGISYAKAAQYLVGVGIALGITAVGADLYLAKGYTYAGLDRGKAALTTTGQYVKETYNVNKARAGRAYNNVSNKFSRTANSIDQTAADAAQAMRNAQAERAELAREQSMQRRMDRQNTTILNSSR